MENEKHGFRELRCSSKNCVSNPKKKMRSPMLLGKSLMMPGSILEIQCPRCSTVTRFESKPIEQK